MSQTATRPSIYNSFDIFVVKEGEKARRVDLSPSIAEFRYYEDIFSPCVTASVTIMATGNVSVGKDKETLIGGLPIIGNERFAISIQDNDSSFNSLSLNNFVNNGATNIVTENNRESFTLNLVTEDSLFDQVSKVEGVLKNNTATTHVLKCLEILGQQPELESNVESFITANRSLPITRLAGVSESVGAFSYKGNGTKPFTVILNLAAKAYDSQEIGTSAGFFFWENSGGYNFRSIDSLISQPPPVGHHYKEVNASLSYTDPQGVDLDRKILAKNVIENNDLWDNFNYGVYSSERFIWDAYKGELSQLNISFTPEEYNRDMSTLGTEIRPFADNIFKKPSRRFATVLNSGATQKSSVSSETDPTQYLSQTAIRYNSLMSQVINIIVPSNLSLRAGDTILCDFPVTGKSEIDQKLSGKYLIKELCHYFSQSESYTSLLIVRDTYGRSAAISNNTK